MRGTATLITIRHASKASACPGCGANSARVHSRFRRRLLDLPMSGCSVVGHIARQRAHPHCFSCLLRLSRSSRSDRRKSRRREHFSRHGPGDILGSLGVGYHCEPFWNNAAIPTAEDCLGVNCRHVTVYPIVSAVGSGSGRPLLIVGPGQAQEFKALPGVGR
jgi:hypothetical protein